MRAAEQFRGDVVARRKDYHAEVQQIPVEDRVFIDESGIATTVVRRFARALGGRRAVVRAPAGRYEKLTLLGPTALSGLLALMTIPAATDGTVFLAFIQQVLAPELRQAKWSSSTTWLRISSPGVRAAIEGAGFRVIFLPPYPRSGTEIEPCWSKMKEFLRSRAATTRDTLEVAVADAMNIITTQDARGWFRYCGYQVDVKTALTLAPCQSYPRL